MCRIWPKRRRNQLEERWTRIGDNREKDILKVPIYLLFANWVSFGEEGDFAGPFCYSLLILFKKHHYITYITITTTITILFLKMHYAANISLTLLLILDEEFILICQFSFNLFHMASDFHYITIYVSSFISGHSIFRYVC